MAKAELPKEATAAKEAAVQLARDGKVDRALEALAGLSQRYPDDLGLIHDRIVILSEAGKSREALALFGQLAASAAPVYVIRAVVDACRELKETDTALKLVDSRLATDPKNVEWRIRRAQLLVDKGQALEAAEELEKFREVRSKNPDWLDVRIYAAQVAEDWMAVLRYSEEKLKGQADPDLSTLGLKADALIHLGAAHAAERLLQEHPGLRTAPRTIDLLDRVSGVELRWSGFASLTMAERQERAERVIKRLEEFAGDTKLPPNLASLRVLALHNANRWREAVDAYQALREETEVAPDITAAAAGSFLALKQPRVACDLYREALEGGSTEASTFDGLFYSLVEMEDFDGAYELLDHLISTEPPWRYYSGTPDPVGNGRRLDLEMTAVSARYFGDQLDQAWRGIDRLSRAAPGNRWLARMRASIALARGWRHQALKEFKTEAALNPASVEALVGVAQSQLQLGDYQKAEDRLLDLEKNYPENPEVQRVRRDWQVYEMPEWWSDFRFMRSQGPELDGDGVLATAEFYGAPFSHRWRPVVQGRYAWAEIIEGESYLSHIGAGAEYRSPHWELLASGGYVESRLREDPAGQVRIGWNPDDHWNLTAEYSTFNLDTPLRALWYGIAADRSGASLAYRWHESRQLSMRLSRSDFTDGNERWEAGASLRQRLIDIPHLDVDGMFNVYGSQNTRGDAPYFNPEEDFSLSLGLDAEQIIWRRYDRTWVQRFIGELGSYGQRNFSADWTGRVGYEQRLTLYPGWEMVAGVEGGRRVYDGEPEPFFGFNILIHARF